MQSTEDWFGNDSAIFRRFDDPRKWSVVSQRLVRRRGVVVVDVFREDFQQVRLAEDDDVIETFSPDRADDALDQRILPRRTRRDDHLLDSHVLEALLEVESIDAITISDQVLRSVVKGEGFDDLLSGPCRGRMCGDVEVNHLAPIVSEHDEAVEDSESDCWDGEEIDRGDVLRVVLQE